MADPRLSRFAVGLVQGVHWLAGLFGWGTETTALSVGE